ncbi:hypothetical protein KCP78_01825 [Salmonella enterica subsp. enterica]|nr:hypothetical protein KCP78_01825 [Salmonella enterica subsp. enterica]
MHSTTLAHVLNDGGQQQTTVAATCGMYGPTVEISGAGTALANLPELTANRDYQRDLQKL